MTERARRRDRASEQILEAAAKTIAAHGFHGMTMRSLAKATGMSLANFYNYFSSKDELLLELHERALTGVAAATAAMVDGAAEPRVQLYRFIETHVGLLVQHTDVMRVLIYEGSHLDREGRRRTRRLKEEYLESALRIVEALLAQDGREPLDQAGLERATYSLFGMLNWVYAWYSPKRHGPAGRVVRTIYGMAMAGLLGGAGPYPIPIPPDAERAPGNLPSLLRRASKP